MDVFGLQSGVVQQLFVNGRADTHVLLAESTDMGVNVVSLLLSSQFMILRRNYSQEINECTYKLFLQRYLVELQLVNLGGSAGHGGRGRDQGGQLHDEDQSMKRVKIYNTTGKSVGILRERQGSER